MGPCERRLLIHLSVEGWVLICKLAGIRMPDVLPRESMERFVRESKSPVSQDRERPRARSSRPIPARRPWRGIAWLGWNAVRGWYCFLYENSVVRADRLWRVGGAVRRYRTDVARR